MPQKSRPAIGNTNSTDTDDRSREAGFEVQFIPLSLGLDTHRDQHQFGTDCGDGCICVQAQKVQKPNPLSQLPRLFALVVTRLPLKVGRKMPIKLVAYQKRRELSGAISTEGNKSTGPDEVLKILRRYLQESHESERTIASRIGVNRHTFSRWLSDSQSPKKRTLALA